MSVQGNLEDITVADLIQQNCQARKTARLVVRTGDKEATLFFAEGHVAHAALGDLQGEEVVYEVLEWTRGQFELEPGIAAPLTTIQRPWTGLLLEGARRIDEKRYPPSNEASELEPLTHSEVKEMEIDGILKEAADQVNGFLADSVVGMDGIALSQFTRSKKVDIESVDAQMTLLIKLVSTSLDKLGAGVIEDVLLTTESAYVLAHFLENHEFYLIIVADHRNANLGNMRLISRLLTERVAKAMPK
jgi:predicted regulator of Ras-like GTPase activity (Roadblock/LC7/MglB family)